jgi:DinB superfamily
MNAEQLIDSGLRAWKFNADRIEGFFIALSEEQLQQEVAPGRNRLLYLWGHVAAVNDALLPLLGIGPKLYPELDAMFLANPDRSTPLMFAGSELKPVWSRINNTLWTSFSQWSPSEWVAKHTAVSDEDFRKEPHRNRYSVMLARNTHMAFHYGQAILAKPRG